MLSIISIGRLRGGGIFRYCLFMFNLSAIFILLERFPLISVISSSCHAISMDIPDPLLHTLSIIYRFRKFFKAKYCINTELLYVGSCWLSCLCSSMWRGPLEYVTYEFVLTSPAVSHMSGSPNLDSFRDGWRVGVQLLICGVLPPGLVQYCSQYSCVVFVKLFLYTSS